MYLDSIVLRRITSKAAIHVFVSNGEIWPDLAVWSILGRVSA